MKKPYGEVGKDLMSRKERMSKKPSRIHTKALEKMKKNKVDYSATKPFESSGY